MTTEARPPEPQLNAALELSFDLIASMRNAVESVESFNGEMGKQLVQSATAVATNIAKAGWHAGEDRLWLLLTAQHALEQTRVRLRLAIAWRWIRQREVENTFGLIERELAMLEQLTR